MFGHLKLLPASPLRFVLVVGIVPVGRFEVLRTAPVPLLALDVPLKAPESTWSVRPPALLPVLQESGHVQVNCMLLTRPLVMPLTLATDPNANWAIGRLVGTTMSFTQALYPLP